MSASSSLTPTLDLEERPRVRTKPWAYVVWVAVGGVLGHLTWTIGGSTHLTDHGVLIGIGILPLVMVLSTFVHESGHALAFHLLGWKIVAARVSFLTRSLILGRWRTDYSLRLLFGGYVAAVPTSAVGFTRKFRISIAAGPLANFLMGGLALVLARFIDPGFLHSSFHLFAAWSLFTGVINLAPFRYRGGESDGFRLFRSTRDEHWRKVRLPALMLGCLRYKGVSHEGWNRRWIACALNTSPAHRPLLGMLMYGYFVRNDPDQAAPWLDAILPLASRWSPFFGRTVYCEAAVFQAQYRRDIHRATVWSERAQLEALYQYQRDRLSAAFAFANDDLETFLKYRNSGLEHLRSISPCPELTVAIAEWQEETERLLPMLQAVSATTAASTV